MSHVWGEIWTIESDHVDTNVITSLRFRFNRIYNYLYLNIVNSNKLKGTVTITAFSYFFKVEKVTFTRNTSIPTIEFPF